MEAITNNAIAAELLKPLPKKEPKSQPKPKIVIQTSKSDLSFFLQDCFAKMGLNPALVKDKYEKKLQVVREAMQVKFPTWHLKEYFLELKIKILVDNRSIAFALNNQSILDSEKFADFMLKTYSFEPTTTKDEVDKYVFSQCVKNPQLAKMDLTIFFDLINFATNMEDLKVNAIGWLLNIASHQVVVQLKLPSVPLLTLAESDKPKAEYKNIQGSKTW